MPLTDRAAAPFAIRPARPEDAAALTALVRELAVYEHLEHEARATPGDLHRGLFGPRPFAEALLAEADGEPAGFALYFHSYSTFQGRPSLYLEDLFVRSAFRRRGIGRALLVHLARVAVGRGCGRFEWAVLDWNEPAIAFYRSLGARAMDQWTILRVDDDALTSLANQEEIYRGVRGEDRQPD